MGATERHNISVLGAADAPVLLFAHGFGCDQNMWRYVAPQFASEYRVVLFDHVGAGNSDASAYDPVRVGDRRDGRRARQRLRAARPSAPGVRRGPVASTALPP